MELILYSTGCPKCTVLAKKLDNKGLPYTVNSDIGEMLSMGIRNAPVLSVDGRLMEFVAASRWINNYEVDHAD